MGPHGEIHADVVKTIEELVKKASHPDRIFIDIPIGLPDGSEERECDLAARKLLGQPRSSSVFPTPVRAVINESTYEKGVRASQEAIGKKISKQAFAIAPKIKEVDGLLQRCPDARRMIREVHPEICFWALAGQTPMAHSKKKREGFYERIAVLKTVRPTAEDDVNNIRNQFKPKDVAKDDILDALVAAITASAQLNSLQTVPRHPVTDRFGLPMEMLYVTREALTASRST